MGLPSSSRSSSIERGLDNPEPPAMNKEGKAADLWIKEATVRAGQFEQVADFQLLMNPGCSYAARNNADVQFNSLPVLGGLAREKARTPISLGSCRFYVLSGLKNKCFVCIQSDPDAFDRWRQVFDATDNAAEVAYGQVEGVLIRLDFRRNFGV